MRITGLVGQAQFDDLGDYGGVAWYRREFPADFGDTSGGDSVFALQSLR